MESSKMGIKGDLNWKKEGELVNNKKEVGIGEGGEGGIISNHLIPKEDIPS